VTERDQVIRRRPVTAGGIELLSAFEAGQQAHRARTQGRNPHAGVDIRLARAWMSGYLRAIADGPHGSALREYLLLDRQP
jgi:hypothetical protein